MWIIRWVAALLAAALIASLAASLASTQQVLSALSSVGAEISWRQWMSMAIADLNILQTLFPVMCACFFVGFLIANRCHHWFNGNRSVWYIAAGASSIICTLLLMSWIMNLMPVAGARSVFGLALISVSGAIGGYIFARLTTPKIHHD